MPRTRMKEEGTAPDRGADEFDYLPSRQRTPPAAEGIVRARTVALGKRAKALDEHNGSEAHEQGTELIELYFGHADRALGFPSFNAFLLKHWPLDVGVAYERMRIAKLATKTQAVDFGYSSCVLGLRIMEALEIESFDEFKKRPLRLHPDDGHGFVKFPVPAKVLKSVLREIARAKTEDDEPVEVADVLRSYRQIVTEVSASDPGVAALKPIVWADAKGAYVRVTASGPEQAQAAARLYQRLAKVKK